MTSSGNPTKWILDSSALHHMTPHMSLLKNCSIPKLPMSVQVANGSYALLKCTDTVSQPIWTFSNVYHVPNLHINLLSIGKLTDLGLNVIFLRDHCLVEDHTSGRQFGTGHRDGGLYLLNSLSLPASPSATALSTESFLQHSISRSSLFHL